MAVKKNFFYYAPASADEDYLLDDFININYIRGERSISELKNHPDASALLAETAAAFPYEKIHIAKVTIAVEFVE